MVTKWSNRQAVGLNEHIRLTGTNPSLTLTFAIQLSPTIAPKQYNQQQLSFHKVGPVSFRLVPQQAS